MIGRMRDSYVRVFTAVGALCRLCWRKARVPLAFLAVALTYGDQDESLWRDIHQGISQCQFQQVCVHVSRRTPSLEIYFWWFVAFGIYLDGNSSSTAVPILEGHQGPPGVRLHLPAIISLCRWTSSANSRVWDEVTHWGKSFKYTTNNNGPSTVPWGMPDVTGLVSDELPSRTTVWASWERKVAATHSTRWLLKTEHCTYRKKLDVL